MEGIVGGEVQAAAFLAFERPPGYQVSYVYHVAQLADVAAGLDALEEPLGFFVEHVETVPGAVQAEVAADDADVVGHYLVHFLDGLGYEDFFLVSHRSFVVPLWDALVEVVEVDVFEGVAGGGLSVDDGFDERVGGQPVAAV